MQSVWVEVLKVYKESIDFVDDCMKHDDLHAARIWPQNGVGDQPQGYGSIVSINEVRIWVVTFFLTPHSFICEICFSSSHRQREASWHGQQLDCS